MSDRSFGRICYLSLRFVDVDVSKPAKYMCSTSFCVSDERKGMNECSELS